MAELVWTQEAATWLEEIYRYIARDDSAAGQRVVKGIFDKAQLLREFPRLGYHYRAELDGEVRVLVYGRYRIAYLLNRDDTVVILGIFHGALDIERYL